MYVHVFHTSDLEAPESHRIQDQNEEFTVPRFWQFANHL